MASSNSPLRVVDLCKITPNSFESATELSLPLTFFDTFWIKFHPVERIFFYELPNSTPDYFTSTILPKLKHSLSLAVLHYLSLAGNLIWPPQADKPFIFYTPNNNNSVSLTVAHSEADFHHLSGNRIRLAVESRPYIPELNASDTSASTIAFQITLFPNQGFCIGIASHHAILDGKSVTMFMKSWAYLCKSQENNPILPPELTPSFDRTLIQDPEEIDMVYLNNWAEMASKVGQDQNSKSLKIFPDFGGPTSFHKERGTFELTREDIKKLRNRVLLNLDKDQTNTLHLSNFVVSYAYIAITMFKAKEVERNRNKKILIGIATDCRARLDPPLPENYFGNCVTIHVVETEAEAIMQENEILFVVEKLSEKIKRLEKGGVLEGAKERLATFMALDLGSIQGLGTAGSPRFEVYSTDFGWGRPNKVEITSIDRTTGTISLAENRDGSGGVEVGIVLSKDEIERFESLFINGLKDF